MELSLAPGVLIAMPQLTDPNFSKTVVLMLHHSSEGAMGLVINRPTEVSLLSFCDEHDLPSGRVQEDDILHLGGPCELQRGFLLHQDEDVGENSIEVAPGVHLTTHPDDVRRILDRGRDGFRFLLGYAGWGPEQLEREIGEGAWLTGEVRSDRIFETEADQIWEETLGDLGVDPTLLSGFTTERH